jgi:type I thyroxine 5'-deiodinase
VPDLNKLYAAYKDRVAFYVVYIQEAHPVDGWQLDSNVTDKVLFARTRTDAKRSEVANVCVVKLGIKFPALVDHPDDRVERAYTGWPDRLYVIDADGRVAYKSGAGPFGFKPQDVEATLKQIVPSPAAKP